MGLVLDMHRLGHPSYAHVDEATVRARAANLPENGVPPEVLKVVFESESTHDDLQPQKAATPCDGMQGLEAAGKTFAAQRARAIVAEGQRRQEANATEIVALQELRDSLLPEKEKESSATIEVRTGNQFLDQFQPDYFSIAFPFCFKYATACPDVTNAVAPEGAEAAMQPRRQGGNPQAPTVDIRAWAANMARRVETQFRRDWGFYFTLWNYLFRTLVNLQKNAYMYSIPDPTADGRLRMMTREEIAKGAMEVYAHLHNGLYNDISGELKPVNGDLTKLRHVPTLSPAAHKLLSNTEARTRNIPGTQEVRKTMRHQTNANRICYGTSVFVTFSPSERDTALMVKFARARQSDPAVVEDGSGEFQRRDKPSLDVDYVNLSPEALAEEGGRQKDSKTHAKQTGNKQGARRNKATRNIIPS